MVLNEEERKRIKGEISDVKFLRKVLNIGVMQRNFKKNIRR